MVLSSRRDHCESSSGSFDECTANPQNKPTDLRCKAACGFQASTPIIAIYYDYLAYQNADRPTHFTVSRRVEGVILQQRRAALAQEGCISQWLS